MGTLGRSKTDWAPSSKLRALSISWLSSLLYTDGDSLGQSSFCFKEQRPTQASSQKFTARNTGVTRTHRNRHAIRTLAIFWGLYVLSILSLSLWFILHSPLCTLSFHFSVRSAHRGISWPHSIPCMTFQPKCPLAISPFFPFSSLDSPENDVFILFNLIFLCHATSIIGHHWLANRCVILGSSAHPWSSHVWRGEGDHMLSDRAVWARFPPITGGADWPWWTPSAKRPAVF